MLLDTFGDHRNIVPCFKALRLLLGLDLAAPLSTIPELKAVILNMPVDQLRAVAMMLRVTLRVGK